MGEVRTKCVKNDLSIYYDVQSPVNLHKSEFCEDR